MPTSCPTSSPKSLTELSTLATPMSHQYLFSVAGFAPDRKAHPQPRRLARCGHEGPQQFDNYLDSTGNSYLPKW